MGHPGLCGWVEFSKLDCDGKLKLSGQRAQAHAGNDTVATRGCAVDTCAAGIGGRDVVERIKRIDAKLPNDTFMDGNVFQQGKIIGEERGTEIIVSSYVAELGNIRASKDARLRSVVAKRQPRNKVGPGMRGGAKRSET